MMYPLVVHNVSQLGCFVLFCFLSFVFFVYLFACFFLLFCFVFNYIVLIYVLKVRFGRDTTLLFVFVLFCFLSLRYGHQGLTSDIMGIHFLPCN